MPRISLVVCVLFVTSGASTAQTVKPTFEVASVKPTVQDSNEPIGASFNVEPGGRLRATGATLRDLVKFAYDLQEFQLEGGTAWMASSRFDVTARADSEASRRELRAMLQSLLRDRFKLSVRRESRTLPVYELVTAGKEARGGAALRRSMLDCTRVLDGRETLDVSEVNAGQTACQPRGKFVFGPAGATMTFERKGMTMELLARLVMPFVRRPVIDQTGLAGTFDIELTFSPENALFNTRETGLQAAPPAEGMSIQTALGEQLGLRLESARRPSEMWVIESAQQPTEN
jgi:uncharacterized protein (TIGR03435 family)